MRLTMLPFSCENAFESTRPIIDAEALISRRREASVVRTCLGRNEYVSVLAPRQTGKSTFLNEIRKEISNCIYIDLEGMVSGGSSEVSAKVSAMMEVARFEAKAFLSFLNEMESQEYVFLFDELNSLGSAAVRVLAAVRAYYIESIARTRSMHKFVIAGSIDLADVTLGSDWADSPYNIAVPLYLEDFNFDEIQDFIVRRSGSAFSDEVVRTIFEYTRGHPYLVQFVCRYLYSLSGEQVSAKLASTDVLVNESGLEGSVNVQSMVQHLFGSEERTETVWAILRGEKVPFSLSSGLIRKLFLADGCIRKEGRYCSIRNPIYKIVLEKNFKIRGNAQSFLPPPERFAGGGEDWVRSEIADEVKLQVKKAFDGPVLANYQGFLSVRALQDGNLLPLEEQRRFRIVPGRQVTLAVSFGPVAQPDDCTMAEEVSIRDGENKGEVCFQLELESATLEFMPPIAALSVKLADPSTAIEFIAFLPEDGGQHSVWVQVFQQNRLVQTAEVRFLSGDQRMDNV